MKKQEKKTGKVPNALQNQWFGHQGAPRHYKYNGLGTKALPDITNTMVWWPMVAQSLVFVRVGGPACTKPL